MVVDMRRVKTAIKKESYSKPTIEETVFNMSGATCFSD